MARNVSDLTKVMNSHIQKSPHTLITGNIKRAPSNIIIKFLKINDRKLKSSPRKRTCYLQRNRDKEDIRFLMENNGTTPLKK